MRVRAKFLAFLLGFAALSTEAVVRRQNREIPVQSSRSLRQQVDSYMEMLEKETAKLKTNKETLRSLNRIIGQIKSLRENSDPQTAVDEAYLDLMVSSLEFIPSESKFKKKDCKKYESDFIEQFEPTAEDSPEGPAVQPGWKVLRSLCQ